jgi:hypothetical protein
MLVLPGALVVLVAELLPRPARRIRALNLVAHLRFLPVLGPSAVAVRSTVRSAVAVVFTRGRVCAAEVDGVLAAQSPDRQQPSPRRSRGLCESCYRSELHATYPRCDVETCTRPSHRKAGGLCTWCLRKEDRWGSVEAAPGKGAPGRARSTRTSDGRRLTSKGYVLVQDDDCRWHLEHRVVMAEILGRDLLPREQVHHKNTQKADNAPSNLELWIKVQPTGGRVEDLVAWAREIIDQYGDLHLPSAA